MKGKIILISAIGLNNEIGNDGKLLFNNKTDKEFFQDITKNRIVVMGRKTYDSIGKPLENRKNIVLTNDKSFEYYNLKNKDNFYNLKYIIGLDKLKDYIFYIINTEQKNIYIIGGQSLYNEFIDICDEIFITRVYKIWKDADSFFPEINKDKFKISYESRYMTDEIENCDFKFIKYIRKDK